MASAPGSVVRMNSAIHDRSCGCSRTAGTPSGAVSPGPSSKAWSAPGVSPGATDALIKACEDEGLPLLPGAVTATEIMVLLERGYTVQKFFPAEQSGGAAFLKSIGSPIPQVKFCPTGGISLKNAPDYLSLKNILCVGGSWVAPKEAMAAGDWGAITRLAAEARALRG